MKDGRKRRETFKRYPILRKQYNRNGIHKSTFELVSAMKDEISEFEKYTPPLTEAEKKIMIDSCKEFYYEIIMHSIELSVESAKSSKNFEVLEKLKANEDVRKILSDMYQYFNEEKTRKEKIFVIDFDNIDYFWLEELL
jgi:hypothetical protein